MAFARWGCKFLLLSFELLLSKPTPHHRARVDIASLLALRPLFECRVRVRRGFLGYSLSSSL